MKNYLYLLIFGLLLLGSCHSDKKSTVENSVIDLSEALKSDTVLMLSTIADDIEYVPLETTPECLLGNYWNVGATVLKEYIIISDRNQREAPPLKLFTRQGKYIGEIGGIGKGPNEYQDIISYTCLEESDRIYLLNRYPAKLLVFNFNRQCLGTIPVAQYAAKVVADKPDRLGIMYLPHTEMKDAEARFEWIDQTGKILKSVPLYTGRPKDGGGMYSLSSRLQIIGDEVHFFEHPFDTVYRLDEDKGFQSVWSFQLGPGQMPRESMLDRDQFDKNFQTSTFLSRSFETPTGFFIQAIQNQKTKTIYFSKKDHQAKGLKMIEGYEGFFLGTQGFVNDLDGGAPFWPKSGTGNQLVSMTSPLVLIPALKDHPAVTIPLTRPALRDKLLSMVGQLKEDDNPVVVIVKTK